MRLPCRALQRVYGVFGEGLELKCQIRRNKFLFSPVCLLVVDSIRCRFPGLMGAVLCNTPARDTPAASCAFGASSSTENADVKLEGLAPVLQIARVDLEAQSTWSWSYGVIARESGPGPGARRLTDRRTRLDERAEGRGRERERSQSAPTDEKKGRRGGGLKVMYEGFLRNSACRTWTGKPKPAQLMFSQVVRGDSLGYQRYPGWPCRGC